MRAEKAKRKQPNREAGAAIKQDATDQQEASAFDQLPSVSDLLQDMPSITDLMKDMPSISELMQDFPSMSEFMEEMEFPAIDISDFDIDP